MPPTETDGSLPVRQILAALADASVLVTHQDADLRYTLAPCGVPGSAGGQPLGRTDADLLPAATAQLLAARKREVLEQARAQRLEIAVAGRHFDLTLTPLHEADGTVCGVACVAVDVTERARIEDGLRRTGARLAEAERLARMGSWEWDIANNAVTWSDGLFEIYGIDPADFEGRYLPSSDRVHPDDRERVDALVRDALSTGRPIDVEYRIVRPDGRIRRLHGRAEVRFGEDGRPVRLTGTTRDVTEQRAAEAALEDTAAELARRAADLQELSRADTPGGTGVARRLTDRQLEILRLIADGHSNQEVANRLFVSEGTVKWHVRQILQALGVANRAQAVARMLREGPAR